MGKTGIFSSALAALVLLSSAIPALAQEKRETNIFPANWTSSQKARVTFEIVDFTSRAITQPWYITSWQAGNWFGGEWKFAQNKEPSPLLSENPKRVSWSDMLIESVFSNGEEYPGGVLLQQYPEDPNERMEQLLFESDSFHRRKSRSSAETPPPSPMKYERIHGGLGPE